MKRLLPYLLPVLFVLSASKIFASDIYGYVDENGTVKFTNMNPPPSAKVAVIGGKDEETPEAREERLRDKHMEEKQKQIEKLEKLQSNIEERERRMQDDQREEREKRDRALRARISAEHRSLAQRKENWMNKCDELKRIGYQLFSECEDRVNDRFTQLVKLLNTSSDYYFENDYRIDRETRETLDHWYRENSHEEHKNIKIKTSHR